MTNKLTPETRLIDLPSFGAELPGEGGYFAGIAPTSDGGICVPTSDGGICALILAPETCPPSTWIEAMRWAAGLEIEGHTDFMLPTRTDQLLLFATVGNLFASDWYWSGMRYAIHDEFAWVQDFGNGYQYYERKSHRHPARAIRRLTIR